MPVKVLFSSLYYFYQNIFYVNKPNGTIEQGIAYIDPENNMTQSRSDITIDAAGNIICFENSNEAITLIAPPFGLNSFTTPAIDPIVVTSATGVESSSLVPENFYMAQNFPNPFNPTTSIRFGITSESVVDLRVYNTLGQEVAVLLNHQIMGAGSHTYSFDASTLASGTYIYKLQAGNNVVTKKMLLMK